ncbi:MAG: DUF3536 domain-containing protein, partial [Acidobacteriaceae bacterium]
APHQCSRVRQIAAGLGALAWRETPNAEVDPTQPYLVRTREGRSITVFFYDGPASRAVAFEGLLEDGGDMARRLLRGFRENDRSSQLMHIATDGESYGHHHRNGDMALSYALQWVQENSNVRLINYGQFLEQFPPTYEAEIYDNTSWSCGHGIERWRSDCGCGNGSQPEWNQRWRAPLRSALDGLRDGVRPLWEQTAAHLLKNPEAARDQYIQVILNRTPVTLQTFLVEHALRPAAPGADAPAEHVAILKLMELERHLQLMYTSCGWFFDDLAGIETVQVISYAARVLQLAAELFGDTGAVLEAQFLERIEMARSNAGAQPGGAEIYRRSMAEKVSLEQVGARHAILSLFEPQPERATRYCFDIHRESGEVLTSGRGRFTYGQAEICSRITLECAHVDFAVLHLGDQNLSAVVRRTAADSNSFQDFARNIREAVNRADLPAAMRLFGSDFGSAGYSLSSLFRDDQRRILKILLDSTLREMEGTLRTIYEDHVSLLRYLSLTDMPKPQALLLAAQFTLNADLRKALLYGPFDAAHVRFLVVQVSADQIELEKPSLAFAASQRMLHTMEELEKSGDQKQLPAALEVCDTLRDLPFEVDFWETQNRWYKLLQQDWPQSEQFRELGTRLEIDVDKLAAAKMP